MSRVKRWFNAHKKEFNSDGTLKDEARKEMLSEGMSNEAIDDYALRLKARYEELNLLDETEPEPWPVYTAYDFFTPEEKRQFNADGSLKAEYIQEALSRGTSSSWLEEMERRKKIDIDNYNALSAEHAEQGINYGAWLMKGKVEASRTYVERRKQMAQDLRNFEDIDTLPFDIDTHY